LASFSNITYAKTDTKNNQDKFSWKKTKSGVISNIFITVNKTYKYKDIGVKFKTLPSTNLKLSIEKTDKNDLPAVTKAQSDAYNIKLLDTNNNEITKGFDIQVTFYGIENKDNIAVVSFDDLDNINNAKVENFEIQNSDVIVNTNHLTVFVVTKIIDHTSSSGEFVLSDNPADTPDEPLPTTINVNDNSDVGALKIKGWWPTVSTNIGTDYVDFHFGDISGLTDFNTISFIANLRTESAIGAGGVDPNDFDAKLYAKKSNGDFVDLAINKNDLIPNFNTGESGSTPNYELISIPINFSELDFNDFVIRYSVAAEHTGPHTGLNGLTSYFDYTALDVKYVADTTAPNTPTSLTIFQNNIDLGCNSYTQNRTITIDWADNTEPDFDHYVYQNLSGSFTTNLTSSEFTGNIANTDGLYGYRVKAVDKSGNESDWTNYCYITLDRVAPTMSDIKMLVNGIENDTAKVGDSVTISATSTDLTSPIEKIELWVRKYPYSGEQITSGQMTNTSGNTWKFTFTMPENYQSGNPIDENLLANYFNFRPYDMAQNNVIVYTTKFTFANPPNIPTLLSPPNGSVITGSDAILDWSDETDLNGPVTYNYKSSWLPSGNYGPVSTGTTSQIDATNSSDNTYNWQVQACDSFNNCSNWSDPFEVTIDSTKPTATVQINNDNNYTNNKTVTLTLTASDNLSGVFQIAFSNDGVTYSAPETFSTTKTWDLTDTDGTKTVYVKVTDRAGNEYITSDLIILDKTTPTSTITLPTNTGSDTTAYVNNWNGIITGTSNDDYEIDNVQISVKRLSDNYYFNGTNWVSSATEILINTTTSDLFANWSYDLPDPTGNETYTITSHATDKAGNVESSYTLTLIYDITIPQVNLAINPTNPNGNNGIYVSKPKITLTASDNYDVDYIEYKFN